MRQTIKKLLLIALLFILPVLAHAGQIQLMAAQNLAPVSAAAPAFAPDDLSNLVLWLRASDIVGLSDGENIPTWNDSSTQNYNVTQTTGSKQPTYETNELNGKPVVRFDGNDTLSNMTAIMGSDPSFTVFVVAKGTDWDSATNDLVNIGDNFTQAFIYRTQSSNTMQVWQPNTINLTGSTLTDANWYYFSYVYNASTNDAELWTDGISNDTASIGGIDPDKTYIGSFIDSFYYTGDIAEIIIYEDAKATSDRQSVETYISTEYNL